MRKFSSEQAGIYIEQSVCGHPHWLDFMKMLKACIRLKDYYIEQLFTCLFWGGSEEVKKLISHFRICLEPEMEKSCFLFFSFTHLFYTTIFLLSGWYS